MADEISTESPEPTAPPGVERWLKIVLRITGTFLLPALVAVVMPRSWIGWAHRQLGLGELAGGVLTEYLARSLSAFYAVVGGLLWLLSCDVRRYLPVIRYIAATWLALGMAVVAILAPHANQSFYRLIVCDAAAAWMCSLAMLLLAMKASLISGRRSTVSESPGPAARATTPGPGRASRRQEGRRRPGDPTSRTG